MLDLGWKTFFILLNDAINRRKENNLRKYIGTERIAFIVENIKWSYSFMNKLN